MNSFLKIFAGKDKHSSDKDSKVQKKGSSKREETKKERREKRRNRKSSKSSKRSSSATDATVATAASGLSGGGSLHLHGGHSRYSVNEQLIENYIATVNAHSSVEAMLEYYANENVRVKFDDAPPMTSKDLQTEIHRMVKSFTDFRFTYESIKEVRPGEVLVDNLCVTGTHNGEPYALGPLPPIDAAGKHVVLDPECIWFTLEDEKIVKEDITALGSLCGPPGFYILIGGTIPGQ